MEQPIPGFTLVAETCCHHEVWKGSMDGQQLFDDWPALISLHPKFFAEGPSQSNRKAGGVGLPQPVGLQWRPA